MSEHKHVPSQRFVGMQVIDNKAVVVGNVKDISVSFQDKSLAFRVTTKDRSELDISWDDVQSVEDVILLKKEVDLSIAKPSSSAVPVVTALLVCPNCGTSAPGHATFCPKCGHSVK
ncbi:MAG TPA: zinc-ribbon domain-containing protein [Candidatus Acidoferrum sp.]|nr:zinc-ribbon domain-containing protein [Candidatus Acidoferrum sp.]